MNEKQKKMENAGNPLLLLFIFGAIIAFLFFIPNIYEKYNADNASLYGIGGNKEKTKNVSDDDKSRESEYFGLNGYTTFDNIDFNSALINNDTFSINARNKLSGNMYLTNEKYYIEFYKSENEKTLLGRRVFESSEPINNQKETTITIDINGITTDENTIMKIVYTNINDIPEVQLENNTLTCIKNNETYVYSFDDKFNLTKLDYKIVNTLDENNLNTYRLLKEQLDNLNGVTTAITEEESSFTFNTVLDYTVSKYYKIELENQFSGNDVAKTVKYKSEAKGYDCK